MSTAAAAAPTRCHTVRRELTSAQVVGQRWRGDTSSVGGRVRTSWRSSCAVSSGGRIGVVTESVGKVEGIETDRWGTGGTWDCDYG